MATSKVLSVVNPPPQQDLAVIRSEVMSQSGPLTRSVNSLAVVDPTTYAKADSILSRIAAVRRGLKDQVGRILAPLDEAKKNIDQSRKELTRFRDELDGPLDNLETQVREQMREFKNEERRLLQEAEDKRLEEERRLLAEAEETRRKAMTAPTAQIQKRLETRASDLETKADIAAATPAPAPVQVAHSGVRVVRKVKITDWKALLRGIIDDVIPADIIRIDTHEIEVYRRGDEALVKSWPGVEVYEDTQIVRR